MQITREKYLTKHFYGLRYCVAKINGLGQDNTQYCIGIYIENINASNLFGQM